MSPRLVCLLSFFELSMISLILPSLIVVKIKCRIKSILKSAALTFVAHSVTLIIFCQLAITQTLLLISL